MSENECAKGNTHMKNKTEFTSVILSLNRM